ncbi:hypothetical protein MBLNU457_6395t1 [Dothideomycetes sp. NU457]
MQTVVLVSEQIKDYHARGVKYRIQHGSTNSTRTAAKSTNFVDLSNLNHVIKVDTATKTALVEPNVPMDRLVEATLPYGLIPPVVMDFPGITVGGGYAGTSGESSSFRHGFFNKTMNWIELVLPDGTVTKVSSESHADLFHSAAGAVGTLGTTTLAELQLVKAEDYVETTYHRVTSIESAVSKLQSFSTDPSITYLDAIMYSPTLGAIVTGKLTSTATTPIRRFSAPSDPWFYLHVQSCLTTSTTSTITETLPLAEYLFRYDRGGFWVGALAFKYFNFIPFNARTRSFLDDFLHTRMMYTALHRGGAGREVIVQDVGVPYEKVPEFVQWTDTNTRIWPLWLCPLRTPAGRSFHPHLRKPLTSKPSSTDGEKGDKDQEGQMLNIGLWGFCPPAPAGTDAYTHYIATNRAIEDKLARVGGMKWLYAQTFYTEDEFWDIYGGRKWYDDLRAKYGATGLPSVYEKVATDTEAERRKRARWSERIKGIWPIGGFWGIWEAIKSRSYVEARASKWKDIRPEDRKE